MGDLKNAVCVMVGGAFGALSRYLLGGWVQRRYGPEFPWGTLVINLTGCVLLGLFTGVRLEGRYAVPPLLVPGVAIGFVGAYTTFSTFCMESVLLMEGRNLLLTLVNVGASVMLGLVLTAIGYLIGRQI